MSVATIHIVENGLLVPGFKSQIQVNAVLPPSYNVGGKKYPVVYLHETINLWNSLEEGKVEESVKKIGEGLGQEVIVILIDLLNADNDNEYSPYYSPLIGDGQGRSYLNLLISTIIPLVNSNWRTLSDAENTIIGGSYMSGLLSLYAGLNHPDCFGKVMAFVPSLWASPMIYHQADQLSTEHPLKVYFCKGNGTNEFHFPNMERLQRILERKVRDNPRMKFKCYDGQKQELSVDYCLRTTWEALDWLFFEN